MSRREAKAVPEKYLSDSQILAIERIAKSLRASLSNPKKSNVPPTNGTRTFDDGGRINQTFFVSGEPGTGKTSVHLTLRQFLERGGWKGGERLPCTKQLYDETDRMVWLTPLDLESEGESTNFLAAVLVRISAVLERERSDASGRRPSLLEEGPLQDLYRVQNDLLLAWDSMHPQRATRIDPEVLAQEALRAEKAKLRVNERLGEVLRAFPKSSSGSTLFVLPVDDFYLKPRSSLEFLRLLRMISVPELFVIVTGDLEVLKELLYQDRLGLLVTLAGETLQTGTSDSARLTARAGALTSQSLQKLIPLAQRTVLEFMSNLSALDFVPEEGETETLEKLLAKVDLGPSDGMSVVYRPFGVRLQPPPAGDPGISSQNLSEFLIVPPKEPEEPEEPDSRSDEQTRKYSGLAILDLPPREIVDLWHSLAELVRRNDVTPDDLPDRVLKFVIGQVREALDHDAELTQADKDACWSAIDGVYWKPFMTPAKLRFTSRGVTRQSIRIHDDTSLVISEHTPWVICPAQSNSISGYMQAEIGEPRDQAWLAGMANGHNRNLAPRPAAWFTVLYDLMVMWDRVRLPSRVGRDELESSFSEPLTEPLDWASVHRRIHREEGEGTCRDHGKPGANFQCLPIYWPVPHWLALRQFDLLGFEWNATLKHFEELAAKKPSGSVRERGDCNPVAWLIYHWIMPITRQLRPVNLSDKWRIGSKEDETWWCISFARWGDLEKSIKDLWEGLPRPPQKFAVERPVGARDDVAEAWMRRLKTFLEAQFVADALGAVRKQLLSAMHEFTEGDNEPPAGQAERPSDLPGPAQGP